MKASHDARSHVLVRGIVPLVLTARLPRRVPAITCVRYIITFVRCVALREDSTDRHLVDISPLAEIARPFREIARGVARVERPAPRRHRRGRDVEEAERDRAVHGVRYTNFTLRGCQ